MAPLYLFLASSLNVELVYLILTSVTQFAYLRKDDRGVSFMVSDPSTRTTSCNSGNSGNSGNSNSSVEVVETESNED